MHPQITHMPCDLNQQQKRRDAQKARVARAIEHRRGKRSLLDRLLGRVPLYRDVTAEDLRLCETGEDVFHGLQF
jgi:hypothetical protein